MKKFEDNRINRAVLDEIKVYPSSRVADTTKGALYVQIPDKIRKEMGITHYNQHEFKLIIVRKTEEKP